MSDQENHGGVAIYWWFCIILCVITAMEWAIFDFREEWGISNTLLVTSLSIFSLVKFTMVVGWYMHLRYDPRMLKSIFIFSLLVIFGLATGLVVLMA
jgi:cytochrome c oxidase subunit 4